jgi:hypothetical protein
MKRSTKTRIITIFILLTFLGSSITYAIISAFPGENTVSGWRAQLVIIMFGEQYPIPAEIGYTNESKAKVYTTSTDGILYKSISEDVTLKDFFDTWNKTFNSTCILDYCNTNTSSMVMYVNERENFDYEYYIIKNNDIIVIDYR